MKTLLKVAGAILVCLVLLLLVLRITGLDPKGLRPGLWLTGNVVTTPVADWSFADKIMTVQLQTRTWYLLPHSVNIGCVYYNGYLYVSSVHMRPGVKYRWNDDVLRDPRVRLKIGNQLFDRTVTLVTDPAEKEAVLQAKAKKYSDAKVLSQNLTSNVFRVPEN
ncbi:MAG: hypothetical protein LAN18_11050 [Acidobacteriia bacterium]|nr:hypothetical protein [Terriglobia bacterium]